MSKERYEAISLIMKAKDKDILKFLAVQKYYEMCKSTGNDNTALEVLKSSLELDGEK